MTSPRPHRPPAIVALYERLREKGYRPRHGSNVAEAYLHYSTATGTPEWTEVVQRAAASIMQGELLLDYPEVFRCYYLGVRRKLQTGKSWDHMLLAALQRWLAGDGLNPIDFILQNP